MQSNYNQPYACGKRPSGMMFIEKFGSVVRTLSGEKAKALELALEQSSSLQEIQNILALATSHSDNELLEPSNVVKLSLPRAQ